MEVLTNELFTGKFFLIRDMDSFVFKFQIIKRLEGFSFFPVLYESL